MDKTTEQRLKDLLAQNLTLVRDVEQANASGDETALARALEQLRQHIGELNRFSAEMSVTTKKATFE